MTRSTKRSQNPEIKRKVKSEFQGSIQRITKITENSAFDLPIAWNFSRMDTGGKFKCSLSLLHEFIDAIIKLEGKSVKQLMEKKHNHPMSPDKLSKEAKNRIGALNLDVETLYQLDLKTPVRLWGVLEYNIFHIIWLDKEHQVYQCK